jgi:hypothetical protein
MQIIQSCEIANGTVWVNGRQIYESQGLDFLTFISDVYRVQKLMYPKFFKMDTLCKLALAGSSIILDQIESQAEKDIALVFANSSSCIDIDSIHQSTIADQTNFFPSPANFVYTLPNIAIGEVSIKYQLKSESAFFILEQYDHAFLIRYAQALLNQNQAKYVLIAWIELNKLNYEGKFFLVSHSTT